MKCARAACAGVLLLVWAPLLAEAQDYSRYRAYAIGSSVSEVAALAENTTSAATTVHERPALLQELEWRPSYLTRRSTSVDPIQRLQFSFYDDRLYRIVVDYDRERTQGLKDADIIDAVAATYGTPSNPTKGNARAASQFLPDAGESIASWQDGDHAVVLYRTPYTLQFKLVLTSRRLDGLARLAGQQALQLDQREAPQRERARQQKERQEAQAALEKTRDANKAAFKP